MGLEKRLVNFVKMLTDDGAVGWWWLMLVLLDHACLPWHCSGNRVVVVFQVFQLLFDCLGLSVSRNRLHLLLPSISSSPFSRYQLIIGILPVHHCILDSRISHPHRVVAENGSKHNSRGYIWLKVYGSEQITKLIGQDAKGVFGYSPAADGSVIVDSFWDIQAMPPIWFHHISPNREGIIANKKIWCVFIIIWQVVCWSSGKPMISWSITCFNSQSSKI